MATTLSYTLSLHDALPIYLRNQRQPILERLRAADELAVDAVRRNLRIAVHDEQRRPAGRGVELPAVVARAVVVGVVRSEEHTSELQSHVNIVCRLLLEKKK